MKVYRELFGIEKRSSTAPNSVARPAGVPVNYAHAEQHGEGLGGTNTSVRRKTLTALCKVIRLGRTPSGRTKLVSCGTVRPTAGRTGPRTPDSAARPAPSGFHDAADPAFVGYIFGEREKLVLQGIEADRRNRTDPATTSP